MVYPAIYLFPSRSTYSYGPKQPAILNYQFTENPTPAYIVACLYEINQLLPKLVKFHNLHNNVFMMTDCLSQNLYLSIESNKLF